MTQSLALAGFATDFSSDALPPALKDLAARSVFSAASAALAALGDGQNRAILATLADLSPNSAIGVFGGEWRFDPLNAAFANGFLANALDFDDTHQGTILHPTAPVLGTVTALAEHLGASPTEAMTAFTLGVEIACRIADAVSPEHYDRGWHITSTCGVFGAAAAAGRLLRLTQAEMLWAFGHAAAQAAGTVENLGTSAKSIGVGQAARGGLFAALLARRGVAGPARPLEGKLGWLSLVAEGPRLVALTKDLGQDWSFARNMLKPYPCGVVLNPVLEAALCLHAELPAPERITRIELRGHPLLKARTDRPEARGAREMQVCAQHAVSAALLRGRFGPEEVSEAAAADPAILALRAKVAPLQIIEGVTIDAAEISVISTSGTLTRRIEAAKGSLSKPLGWADLEAKAAGVTPRAQQLRRFCEGLWDEVPLTAVTDFAP